MALRRGLLVFAGLAVEPGRKDLQDFAAREDRWLPELLVETDRKRVLGRAGAALRKVLPRAELSLRWQLSVYESRKLLGRYVDHPHLWLRRVKGLRCRVSVPERFSRSREPAPDRRHAAA